ncbi:MAG: hypothetical protein M1365_06540 [Actinobacteria bacterium]|nr:hypothetical protein [Actinomycetota bacterium]
MAYLELKQEELITLKEVLENDIDGLRAEIIRTDKREFREMLKHKEQILEKIFSMLQTKGKS